LWSHGLPYHSKLCHCINLYVYMNLICFSKYCWKAVLM
jgi:hypothetical protein